MFVRNVSIQLKPNTSTEFAKIFEAEILPLLRKQTGFQNEISYGAPDSNFVNAISLWDSKEDADKYARAAYPDILNSLSNFIEGTPTVQTYLLAFSTAHRIELGTVPLQSRITTPVPGVGGG